MITHGKLPAEIIEQLIPYAHHAPACAGGTLCGCGLDEVLHAARLSSRFPARSVEYGVLCRDCAWAAGPFVIPIAAERWKAAHEAQMPGHIIEIRRLSVVREPGAQGQWSVM